MKAYNEKWKGIKMLYNPATRNLFTDKKVFLKKLNYLMMPVSI